MDVMTLTFAGGVGTGVAIVYIMATMHDSVCKRKQRKVGQEPKYETILLDDGTFIIPETVQGDTYNKYVNGYDIHIRENFEQYIRLHVQEWWDEYENARHKELAPLSRTICKYVNVEPVRLKGSWSTDWYAYVKHGAFKIKVRHINQYFNEPYNMEIKITNTDIKENEDGNQIQKTQGI